MSYLRYLLSMLHFRYLFNFIFPIPYFHTLFFSNFFFSYCSHSSILVLFLVYSSLFISCFLTSSFLAFLRTLLLELFLLRIHKLNNYNFPNLQLIWHM